ncbi:uncharacterized protein TNCV_3931101 [Trichonephila clavipes]|nr:uncharacterized protein TNCV_3931101 [Trichonephila clavipes]
MSGKYDKARETRKTISGTNRAAERRPVRSKQATAVRPCPYYLRSRMKHPEGIPEERRSIGFDSIPQNNIRRRSLSMEALDGDPVDRSESRTKKKIRILESWRRRAAIRRKYQKADIASGKYNLRTLKISVSLGELVKVNWKGEFVMIIIMTPHDDVGVGERMLLLPEIVGEKGSLESFSPTFRIDSSKKGHAGGPVLRILAGSRRQKRALDVKWQFRMFCK